MKGKGREDLEVHEQSKIKDTTQPPELCDVGHGPSPAAWHCTEPHNLRGDPWPGMQGNELM